MRRPWEWGRTSLWRNSAAALAAFLAPLPAGALPGVGKTSAARLASFGYRTVRDVQEARPDGLAAAVGANMAAWLTESSFGHDDRPVVAEAQDEKSISREYTFGEDCTDRAKVRAVLHELAGDVGRRLRKSGRWANEAHLKLRWADFTTITRQKRTAAAIRDDFSLFEEALALFDREREGPVSEKRERRERLSETLDAIRKKFGRDAVTISN